MTAMKQDGGRILLVDFDDARRETRVKLLESRGYEITLRDGYVEAERLDHEGRFDMMIVALHRQHLKALLKSVADMFESSSHIRELGRTGRANRRA